MLKDVDDDDYDLWIIAAISYTHDNVNWKENDQLL